MSDGKSKGPWALWPPGEYTVLTVVIAAVVAVALWWAPQLLQWVVTPDRPPNKGRK